MPFGLLLDYIFVQAATQLSLAHKATGKFYTRGPWSLAGVSK